MAKCCHNPSVSMSQFGTFGYESREKPSLTAKPDTADGCAPCYTNEC